MKGNLFIISSPSGGGKGTLIKEVLNSVERVGYSVSYTTRKRREGEENGKDYFFVEVAEFERRISDGEFLEYAVVHDNYYGTSSKQVNSEIEAGNDVILEIDVQGAEIMREKRSDSIGVFILPPSFEVLKSRLELRNTETAEALEIRLNNAKKEVNAVERFEYVIVNDERQKAVGELISIFRTERLKRDRQMKAIHDILNSFE